MFHYRNCMKPMTKVLAHYVTVLLIDGIIVWVNNSHFFPGTPWNHPWQSPNSTQEHRWYIQYSHRVDALLYCTVSSVCFDIKRTISCETLSAIWFVWWRNRTVETSPSAAKHLQKEKRDRKTKRDRAGKHGEETQRETFCRVKLQGNSARPKLRMSSLNELR